MKNVQKNTQTEATHCRRCKTKLEKGVCPICGFKAYKPMDDKKIMKIQLIGTVIGLVIFGLVVLLIQLCK